MSKAMREFNGTDPEITQDLGGKFVRITFHFDSCDDQGIALYTNCA